MADRRISYAQNGEDVRVWRALRSISHPFYVEVGASHPYEDSVTAALYDEGWHGLLLEPDHRALGALLEHRPRDTVVAAAASDRSGVAPFLHSDVRGQSHITASAHQPEESVAAVPTVRLADVLQQLEVGEVHFMSIDVEGHEKAVLQGLDLANSRPWVLAVEATEPDSRMPAWDAWEDIVLSSSYRFVSFDGLNRWYVAQEHHDLVEAISTPFNVFDRVLDGWTTHETCKLQAAIQQLQTETNELQQRQAGAAAAAQELLDLKKQVGRLERQLEVTQHERDLALQRAEIVLTSKSWALTAPMRSLRAQIDAWRSTRAAGARARPDFTVVETVETPELLRHRQGLASRRQLATRPS